MAKKDEQNKDLTPAAADNATTDNVVPLIKTKKYLYTGFSCVFTFGKDDKQAQKLLTNNTVYPLPSNDETTKKLVRRGKLKEVKESK